jgi:hypothetical protein
MVEIRALLYKRDAIYKPYGYYERPVFHTPRAGKIVNFENRWDTFKSRFNPFLTMDLSPQLSSSTELFFTDKDVSWGTQDANIWIGGEDREINEVDDLTSEEARVFFNIGLKLCRNLKSYNGLDHSLSIGFNPGDLGLPGHHNVKRLHAHLRAYNDPYDLNKIERRQWKDMHWFDRLTFIEPFTQLYFDFIQHSLKQAPGNTFDEDKISDSEGVIDLPIIKTGESTFPNTLTHLYSSMKAEYKKIEDIFTGKELDPESDRYIPKEANEIEAGLESFFSNQPYYSSESQQALYYLAKNIKKASKRPNVRDQFITDPSHVYITKGFAGALTVRHNSETDRFTLEFLPRVITSSAVAKTMFGRNEPTIMGKHAPATDIQIEKLEQFKQNIKQEATRIYASM